MALSALSLTLTILALLVVVVLLTAAALRQRARPQRRKKLLYQLDQDYSFNLAAYFDASECEQLNQEIVAKSATYVFTGRDAPSRQSTSDCSSERGNRILLVVSEPSAIGQQ